MNQLLPYPTEVRDASGNDTTDAHSYANLLADLHSQDALTHVSLITATTKRLRVRMASLKYPLSTAHHDAFIRYYVARLIHVHCRPSGPDGAVPVVDCAQIELYCNTLVALLKKETPGVANDLLVPWRPLWHLVRAVCRPPRRQRRMMADVQHMQAVMRLIPHIRKFFSAEAASEILTEFLPLLCMDDMGSTISYVGIMTLFLPTKPCPACPVRDLFWVEEMFHLWSSAISFNSTNISFLDLFSRLARDQYGSFRFSDEQMRFIFDAGLKLMELPIGAGLTETAQGNVVVGSKNSLSSGHMSNTAGLKAVDDSVLNTLCFRKRTDKFHMLAKLIVYSIYPDAPSAISHLGSLMNAIENFFHPSNSGRWTTRLVKFVQFIAQTSLDRINWEQSGTAPWSTALHIDEQTRHQLVSVLRPALLMAMFGKDTGSVTVSHVALTRLAWIHAESILPPLLEMIHSSLETVTEIHRMTSSLQALVQIATPLVHRRNFPDGVKHLNQLLWSTLPGIDMNDPNKTFSTFLFYSKLCTMIPIHEMEFDEPPQSVHLTAAYTLSQTFEPWLLQVFERTFYMLQHLPTALADNSPESNVAYSLVFFADTLFCQLQPRLFARVLEMVNDFIAFNVVTDATYAISTLCGVMMRVSRHTAGPLLIDTCVRKVRAEMEHGAGEVRSQQHSANRQTATMGTSETKDSTIIWYMSILVDCAAFMSPEMPQFQSVLTLLTDMWRLVHARPVYKLVSAALSSILSGLTGVYLHEYCSFHLPAELKFHNEAIIRESEVWGVTPMERGHSEAELRPSWHSPSDSEKATALHILREWSGKLLPRITLLMNGAENDDSGAEEGRHNLCKEITLLKDLIKGMSRLSGDISDPNTAVQQVDDDEDDVDDSPTGLALRRCPISAGYCFQSQDVEFKEVCELREKIGAQLHTVADFYKTHWEDDVESIKVLSAAVRHYLCNRGITRGKYDAYFRGHAYTKALMKSHTDHSACKIVPRYLHLNRLYMHHLARLKYNANNIPRNSLLTPSSIVASLVQDLQHFAVSSYAKVRAHTQSSLNEALRCHPWLRSRTLEAVFDQLIEAVEAVGNDESNEAAVFSRIKGLLYLLNSTPLSVMCQRQMKFTSRFMLALCKVQALDKPSIQNMTRNVFVEFIMHFGLLSIRPPMPKEMLQHVQHVQHERNALAYSEMSQISVDEVQRLLDSRAENRVEQHQSLVTRLVKHTRMHSAPSDWKIELLICNLLEMLNRPDLPVRADVVSVFADMTVCEMLPLRRVALVSLSRCLYFEKRYARAAAAANSALVPCEDVCGNDRYFVDDLSAGWLCWSQQVKAYPVKAIEAQANFLKFRVEVTAPLCVAEFWDKMLRYSSLESTPLFSGNSRLQVTSESALADESFSQSNMRLYKGFFQLHRDTHLYTPFIGGAIEKLCSGIGERSHQRCVAEFFSGLCRGMKCWELTAQDRAWKWMLPLIKQCLLAITPETLSFWDAFIRAACDRKDPRRVTPLMDLILRAPEFQLNLQSESAFTQSKRLCLYNALLAAFGWRMPAADVDQLVGMCLANLAHPYKQVRELVGSVLCKCLATQSVPQLSHGALTAASMVARMKSNNSDKGAILASLQSASPTATLWMQRAIDDVRKWRKLLETDLSTAMNSTQQQPAELIVQSSLYGRSARTILQWLAEGFSSGRPYIIMPMLIGAGMAGEPFLADLFNMQAFVEQEMNTLTSIVLSSFPEHALAFKSGAMQISAILSALENNVLRSATSTVDIEKQKKQKLKCLAVLQVFLFRHLFTLNDASSSHGSGAAGILRIVKRLLADEVLEVRQLAGLTMSGVVRCNYSLYDDTSVTAIASMRDTFDSWIAQSELSTDTANSIVLKHGGVLGLCALVLAFPYDIPIWLPDVLVSLAKIKIHSKIKNLPKNRAAQTSIQTTFAEFRRTHQDRWAEDVVGYRQDYREIYDRSVPHTESANGRASWNTQKGKFTAKHLDQLEGLFSGNATANYLA